MKQSGRIWLVLSAIMFCFAANSVITRYLVLSRDISPFLVTVIRFVSGLGTLILLTSLRPKRFSHETPSGFHWLGALFLGAYAFSISYGYLFIPVAAGTFVFYTFVVLTMVAYSVLMEKEELTFRLVAGLMIGLLGVLVITFGRIVSVELPGVLLMALTGTSWGLYSVYGKKFRVTFNYTYNTFLIFGAVAIAVTMIVLISYHTISYDISPGDLGLALYMGTVSTALSYVAWNGAVKKIPVSLGGLVQLAVPVIAPIMGIILLREQVTVTLMMGGALVLTGIYLAQPSIQTRNDARTLSYSHQ